MKTEVFSYIILFVGLLAISLIPVYTNDKPEINYCKIDSMYLVPKNENTPELVGKYHTDCGITFTSKKNYNIGDSIEVKTVINK